MKVTVLYFAQFRENLGIHFEEVVLDKATVTVGDVLECVRNRSQEHAIVLANTKRVRMARNEELCFADRRVHEGDTIAFFPPVTGG